MRKLLSYFKLKTKMKELGYNRAEIRSTVSQVRHFDRDLKLVVYYWLNEGLVPGDSDPALMIDGVHSIESVCDNMGYTFLGALILLQAYRRDPEHARKLLLSSENGDLPPLSQEKIDFLREKYGIASEEDLPPESEDDIEIPTEGNEEGST